MTVKVPAEKGTKLSPVGQPVDLVYGGEKIHHGKHKGKDVPLGIVKDQTGPADFKVSSQVEGSPPRRKMPTDPALIAYIQLRNVFVESEEVRGLLGGRLTVSVANNQEVGVIGNIALSRGVLDLFSRRYQVDKAMLHFDGSVDPVLDVRITHDFPEVTTITEVRGRVTKPQLLLSSEPARYSQAELLGFLLGGEPGGDAEMAPSASERVAGAGASVIGNRLGGYVKKALPVDVDVLRYEAASSASSAAVTVGTWITDTLFLAYRRHLEARPDENAGEGEVEYWIQRRLVVEGVIGDRGVNGADLLWRRRW
jgi:translocation and assembly module TamB